MITFIEIFTITTGSLGAALGIFNLIQSIHDRRSKVRIRILYKYREPALSDDKEIRPFSELRKGQEYYTFFRITNQSHFPVNIQEVGTIEDRRFYNPVRNVALHIDALSTQEYDIGIFANSFMQSDWAYARLGDDKLIKIRIPQRLIKIGKKKALVLLP